MIRLVGVHHSYREGGRIHPVLVGADLHIAPGRFVGLLGPSGSGKTTLLNLVSGIDAPDRGEIIVDGTAIDQLGERERTVFRRDRIGFIFQFFNLIPTLTVEENLLLPLELAGRAGEEERERARGILARVGLGGRAGSWPERLSGGEQQRVAVARALVHRPAVVLADEPTGNLDEATGAIVLDLMEELLREAGATLLLVTHSREIASRMDEVLRIREGKVR